MAFWFCEGIRNFRPIVLCWIGSFENANHTIYQLPTKVNRRGYDSMAKIDSLSGKGNVYAERAIIDMTFK
jgi:hypothetical protein